MKLNKSILLPPKKFTVETSVGVQYAYNLSNGSLLQSTDYYAFGLPFSVTNTDKNRYLYNGKEIENNTIGGTQLATLDYGARHYDPIIARWFTTDPMAEKRYNMSPYVYVKNNPILKIDPDGMLDDDYYFDNLGIIKYYIKNDLPDKFYLQNSNGTVCYNNENFNQIDLHSELGYLSRLIYAEAGGENQVSKEAVGEVIKNRVEETKYPDSYKDVAEQHYTTKKGNDIYQFSSVNPNDINYKKYIDPTSTNNIEERMAFANSMSAGIKTLNSDANITSGATLYYSPKSMIPKYSAPKWNFNLLIETTPDAISSKNFRFYK
jgi:RHS repeat-associated protein